MKKLFAIIAMVAVCSFGATTSVMAQEDSAATEQTDTAAVDTAAVDTAAVDTAAGLVGGKHQHLGYLYMLGSLYGIEHHIGHIISGKRLDALINLVGTVLVAVKAHP